MFCPAIVLACVYGVCVCVCVQTREVESKQSGSEEIATEPTMEDDFPSTQDTVMEDAGAASGGTENDSPLAIPVTAMEDDSAGTQDTVMEDAGATSGGEADTVCGRLSRGAKFAVNVRT